MRSGNIVTPSPDALRASTSPLRGEVARGALAVPALNALSATEVVQGIAAQKFTAEAVVRDCLERIAAREPTIHAFANIDAELALRQARELDRGPIRGALHGVPIGVKDVIDTADLPTEMGSPIYRGHRAACDAACVALARAVGAIILGKTVTAEFAGMTPGPTANPHNPAHTPGGSSSGSAAAVTDLMLPAAFGTQTGGSVLRPAAYCGVIGYKPTYNAFNRAGLKFAAESLDTIGLIARSIDDIELITSVLLGDRPDAPASTRKAPSIGLCRTPLWDTAQPETKFAVEDAAARLAVAGAPMREVVLPADFAGLKTAARETINSYERSKSMAAEWASHRDLISEKLRRCIALGLEMPYQDYLAAITLGENCRARLDGVFDRFDVLLAPCVTGEAPKGLGTTGDPAFQAIWTILHVPAMTLPTHRGPNGLPVGIQLVARRHDDRRLFACARWVWERLM
jgi:Asp-tRNA(Asn)/Glu-tRNA(Gln) amidotransferase A subunit family amidase